jgi:hypothetical protein
LYRGITACTADQHVHVEGSADFVSKLISLAEPELNGLRQERHAKTIEIAKKEVLTCIGICLYERFQRIQQRLREGQQSCDILFLIALKSLKKSYDMAFESKQGISDLEKLCQEFDEEEKRKLEKAQKKRDNKKNKLLKKKKDHEKVELNGDKPDEIEPDVNNEVLVEECPKVLSQLENIRSRSLSSSSGSSSSTCSTKNKACDEKEVCDEKEACDENVPSDVLPTSRLTCVTTVCRRTTRLPPQETFSILSLERMLDGSDEQDEGDESEEEGIPLEEIQNFQARQSDVSQQREELRKNLRQRFAQLCVNGL